MRDAQFYPVAKGLHRALRFLYRGGTAASGWATFDRAWWPVNPDSLWVSVVIPSVGRQELNRAVRSVLSQTCSEKTEIILCMDMAEDLSRIPDTLRDHDQVLWTGGSRGASAARNSGVRAARAPVVAFLDDDDEWTPFKVERQLDVANEVIRSGMMPVVATQHIQVQGSGRRSAPVPLRPYRGAEPISRYLFRRRRPGGGRASMYTSTLMVSREAALRVPWDESLPRHQDWDWLIRLNAMPDVRVLQTDWVGTFVHSGTAGSISASTDWQSSLVWADSVLRDEPAGVYADFLVAQTARYALAARSLTGIAAVVRRLVRRREVPSGGPVLIFLAATLPRSTLERLMAVIR